ncbi:carbohydrate kinase [Salinithrix halophila]|uniref:Carbohydrate kinase n=1 Tax=Salinithrix halophila TaxID=1485204 RepID=A0ABV8JDV7_9BACL
MKKPITDKEGFILETIRQNPFISQQELARELGLSRSAVAGIIAGLIKQGRILGRAYMLAEAERVVCIGGANIDRKARTGGPVELYTSNPVHVHRSFGGVARNVAESLGRVGLPAYLMTVVGDDAEGRALFQECEKHGVDLSLSRQLPGFRTGNYTAILDLSGELFLALADMEVYEEMTASMMEANWPRIRNSEVVAVDTNLPTDALEWMIQRSKAEAVKLCILSVSASKAKRLPKSLVGVDLLIGNREEAGAMTGGMVHSRQDVESACQELVRRGVRRVVITMGPEGAVYLEGQGKAGRVPPVEAQVRDVTGAGDAFAAGVIAGLCRKLELETACRIGMAFAKEALESEQSVPLALTPAWMQKRWEENHGIHR